MIKISAKKITASFFKAALLTATFLTCSVPVLAADPMPGANLDIITIKDRLAKKYLGASSVEGRVAADGRLYEIDIRGSLMRVPEVSEYKPVESLDAAARKLLLAENWAFGLKNPDYDIKLNPAKTSRSGNKTVLTYSFYIAAIEIEDRMIELTFIGSELIRLYARIANYSDELRAAAEKTDRLALKERADALRVYFEDIKDPNYPNVSIYVLRGVETIKLASDSPPYFLWIVKGLGFNYRINAFTGEILSRR
ncbi:MAG: hypothetical protein OEV59_03585 [Deltaproteobacteria bacterium]|nr:hypothetical protein [Deltaproteobacteria bacterium]